MKRTSRIPLLPIVLIVVWLVANDSLAPGQILLGVVFALLLTVAVRPLRPLLARPRRPLVALRLIWHVFLDIVRSNIAVGRIILGMAKHHPRAEFVKIPLALRDPHGLAMLSVIITGTPGTIWSGHDPETNILTLHVLDLLDEARWIRTVKERYERPLMEIFE